MTKKDYIRATKIIVECRNSFGCPDNVLIEAFVQFFLFDNPRFDEDRFREACRKWD